MGPLRALLLSDGRPGHFKLAEGILAAVARRRNIETRRLEVRRRGLVPARAVSMLVNQGASPALVLQTAYGLSAADIPECDLVVSAGGNTLGANICASRLHGCANIFYGSLRWFRPTDFSLCLTSYAAQVRATNQLMTLKPSAFDPDALQPVCANASQPVIAGLVVGGDAGTIKYQQSDWERLFSFMRRAAAELGIRWVVSNSPRTPEHVSARISSLSQDKPDGCVASFIDVRKPDAASLDAMFQRVGRVACTADSSSMLSECVWARKPVVAVAPEGYSLPDNEAGYRAWIEDNGWCRSLAIADLTPQSFVGACSLVRPLETNPLERLADEIQVRVPRLFA